MKKQFAVMQTVSLFLQHPPKGNTPLERRNPSAQAAGFFYC